MLKRAGRAHVLHGTMDKEDGCCAVLCPACPQPGKNLEDGWENASPDKQYALVIFSHKHSVTSYVGGKLLYSLRAMQTFNSGARMSLAKRRTPHCLMGRPTSFATHRTWLI
jgi:hypothetical protein